MDCQQYDYDSEGYSNNYKESTIRAWLNDNFYNTAFTDAQKKAISTTNVDNSVASTGYNENEYACENTDDKVFLLSVKEAKEYLDEITRQFKSTDYAKAQGCKAYDARNEAYTDNCNWMLRSPCSHGGSNASLVDVVGRIVSSGGVNGSTGSVVPALTIEL